MTYYTDRQKALNKIENTLKAVHKAGKSINLVVFFIEMENNHACSTKAMEQRIDKYVKLGVFRQEGDLLIPDGSWN